MLDEDLGSLAIFWELRKKLTGARRPIYIAGPMTGHGGFNYAAFDDAYDELRVLRGDEEDLPRIVSPVRAGDLHPDGTPVHSYDFYMRRGIQHASECGSCVLLRGWRQSNGATLESLVVTQCGGLAWDIDEVDWIDQQDLLIAFGQQRFADGFVRT